VSVSLRTRAASSRNQLAQDSYRKTPRIRQPHIRLFLSCLVSVTGLAWDQSFPRWRVKLLKTPKTNVQERARSFPLFRWCTKRKRPAQTACFPTSVWHVEECECDERARAQVRKACEDSGLGKLGGVVTELCDDWRNGAGSQKGKTVQQAIPVCLLFRAASS